MRDALQNDPAGVCARAQEIIDASADSNPSASEVFARLTSLPSKQKVRPGQAVSLEAGGKRVGQQAELPARPSSLWECLADRTAEMSLGELRRVAMLLLRVVCAWRLEDIGRLFDLHKGHVSREIDRAREELSELLREAGIDPSQYAAEATAEGKKEPVKVRLAPDELAALKREAARVALSESKQARLWMLAGGLATAIAAGLVTPEDVGDQSEAA